MTRVRRFAVIVIFVAGSMEHVDVPFEVRNIPLPNPAPPGRAAQAANVNAQAAGV